MAFRQLASTASNQLCCCVTCLLSQHCLNYSLQGRARMGQGYADVLVPQGGGGWLPWGDNRLPPPYEQFIQNNHVDNDPVPPPQQPTFEVSEEQVSANTGIDPRVLKFKR